MSEKKILKAGAIILSSVDKNKIALLYRGKRNDWSFPKGHIDQGENAVQTMVREIKEETGLVVSILQALPDMEYSNVREGMISTKMFLVLSKDDSQMKLEFEGDNIEWIQYNEIIEKLSYDNLKDYFISVLPIIHESYLF